MQTARTPAAVAGSASVGAAMGLLAYEREGRLIVVDAHEDTLSPRLAAILFAVPRTHAKPYLQPMNTIAMSAIGPLSGYSLGRAQL